MTVNGITVAAARSGGVSSYVYDTANSEEVTVSSAAASVRATSAAR